MTSDGLEAGASQETAFAPAERASGEELLRQSAAFLSLPYLRELMDGMPNLCIVVNRQRQIVYVNKPFLDYLGLEDYRDLVGMRQGELLGCVHAGDVLGKRPGEAIGCVHAGETPGGCGTTSFCQTCGAVNAILTSQQDTTLDVRECRLLCKASGRTQALTLRVWCSPFRVGEECFTMFSAVDISHEKRRRVLERIFFHDVLNTAGGLSGLTEVLCGMDLLHEDIREIAGLLSMSSEQLVDEIQAQRVLAAAEGDELEVEMEDVAVFPLIEQLAHQYRGHQVAQTKQIQVDENSDQVAVRTDMRLLRRVVINLLKNALEATPASGTVRLGCRACEGGVSCWIQNETVMPEEVRLQVFNRAFSTKGNGRGVGTYSVKLLTETYLKGSVSFVSGEDTGTVFTVQLPATSH